MLKRIFIGTGVLLIAGAVFAQAYKWVDEDGIVHYSDRPHPGAERVELPGYNTSGRSSTPSPVIRRTTRTQAEPEPEEDKPFRYESLAIVAPAPEETLWNIEGVLNVSLDVQPALQPGHRVRVYFDGEAQMMSGTSFQLQEVWRGVHNVQAEVVDETGKLMIRSLPNRFYVQQNTIASAN